MRLRLTQAALDWFESNNISFHNRFGIRLKTGDPINFKDDTCIEPYVGIHGGYNIPELGFMSYTNSSLPVDIIIGRYCSIAENISFPKYRHPIEHISTSIFTHDHATDLVIRFIRNHKPNYKNFFPNPQKGPVIVGHDVWIGQSVTLMPGITLGTGCVVAANSVVTRSIPPYAIVGGNPAEIIKMRFDQETINRLLDSEWWNYRFTDFDDVDISRPKEFAERFRKLRQTTRPYAPDKIALKEVARFCDPYP